MLQAVPKKQDMGQRKGISKSHLWLDLFVELKCEANLNCLLLVPCMLNWNNPYAQVLKISKPLLIRKAKLVTLKKFAKGQSFFKLLLQGYITMFLYFLLCRRTFKIFVVSTFHLLKLEACIFISTTYPFIWRKILNKNVAYS